MKLFCFHIKMGEWGRKFIVAPYSALWEIWGGVISPHQLGVISKSVRLFAAYVRSQKKVQNFHVTMDYISANDLIKNKKWNARTLKNEWKYTIHNIKA